MHKIALLFPGQGSQKPGMGKTLNEGSARAREIFQKADQALGFKLSELMFEGSDLELTQTEIAQPAILTHSIAAFTSLTAQGELRPAFVAGHSLGEFSALVAAGVLKFEDAVRAVHFRGRVMQEAVPQGEGAMAAVVGLDAESIAALCNIISTNDSNYVTAANFNGDLQTVISGTARGVQEASTALKEAGAKLVVALKVSAPFHCRLMQPAQDRLQQFLDDIKFSDAVTPVISNVGAEPLQNSAQIKKMVIKQVTAPVQFTKIMAYIQDAGVNTVIEIGPGKNLAGIIRRSLKNCTILNMENEGDHNAIFGHLALESQ